MKREKWIAEALCAWLDETLRTESDVAREGLPPMDVGHFLRCLARSANFVAADCSLALTGFGIDETALRTLAKKAGLRRLANVAVDMNTAAAWRNTHQQHPRIIALARGRHPGVHTLRHFAPARSRDLARALLRRAAADETFIKGNARHRELLERLAEVRELEPLRSLECVADFLATWERHAAMSAEKAPLRALPVLGLLADDELFEKTKNIELQLQRNLELTEKALEMRRQELAAKRERFGKWKDRAQRERFLDLLGRVETLQREPSPETRGAITLSEAEMFFSPPKGKSPEPAEISPDAVSPRDDEEEETDDGEGELNAKKLARATAEALLDNRQDELEAAAEAMEDALADAILRNGKEAEGQVEFRGEKRDFSLKLDERVQSWLHKFCSAEAWGGVVASTEPSLATALEHCESGAVEVEVLKVEAVAQPEDRAALSMAELLSAWDEDLMDAAPDLDLAGKWEQFVRHREELVQHLDALVCLPPTWLAGKPTLARNLDEYLKLAAQIYGGLQRHYRQMADKTMSWARAAIEAVLALDVVQVRIALPDGKEAHKAVLLPTHPLHLWRRQRLTAVLRGLGEQLEPRDREAILRESDRPEHFLSVLCVGSIPAGRGANQILPVANDLGGMATFENLLNAYSGPDGADTLAYAISRFAVLGRHHARPLRVVVVNPPDAARLLSTLASIFRKRRRETLPCLELEFFATVNPTSNHSPRIQAALRFDDKIRELLEDLMAAGRLRFRAHEKPRKLSELLKELRAAPCHLLALFDEATIRIRRRGAGRYLPMSPFCVRHEIAYDRRENTLRLSPTTDEPPFSEFMQLINEAESGQRDSSPHAWADAEGLRKVMDEVLLGDGPCAHWLFLADRAVPSEWGLKSVRLLYKRDGQRQVLLAVGSHDRMAELVRGVFDRCGLSMSGEQLQTLLEEGVNLSGAGLLDLIKDDGLPDSRRVLGLAGLLLAARDYRQRHPDSLVVSVDNEVARLWLRLGRKGDRCDLLGLRREGESLVVEAIEVKTTEDDDAARMNAPVRRAQEQISAVLAAVSAAIPDSAVGSDPLSAPRCEMLKEVLVRGCQSRGLPPEQRGVWSGWMIELFRQESDEAPLVQYRGAVVCVLPKCADKPSERSLVNEPFQIGVRYLTAERIGGLLGEVKPSGRADTAGTVRMSPQSPSKATTAKRLPKSSHPSLKPEAGRSVSRGVLLSAQDAAIAAPMGTAATVWPPPVNALGMIGQGEAIAQLLSQVNYARAAGRRFSDKLLVGSAGVGKTSLARAIAHQLLNEDEILFNGSDLRQAAAIITRLKERKKVPLRPRGQLMVQACLIFIDEVHAISSQVETTLLGALEGDRRTSIDNVVYDFSEVVFILATTDSGKLGGAFNSRPDKLYLRNYTLEELAGIVWLRGQEPLHGRQLSRDVCLEIAARTRCRPREAVNCLTERLIPYFHSLTHQPDETLNVDRIAAAITSEAVAAYFDARGIDINGIDVMAHNYLQHLASSGAQAEERLRQALGVSNRSDFIEVDEYLTIRLGLVAVTSAGRSLTADGRKYVKSPFDLRHKISRQR